MFEREHNKTSGVIVFSLKHLAKINIVKVLGSKNLIKLVKQMLFDQQVTFLVRILARECIKRKSVKTNMCFSNENKFAFIFKDYFSKKLQRERFKNPLGHPAGAWAIAAS